MGRDTAIVVVVVVVVTITHRYSAVRGHKTASNNSGVADYLRRKALNTEDNTHAMTETNRAPQTKKKRDQRASISDAHHTLNEEQKPKPRRQHNTHKKMKQTTSKSKSTKREGRQEKNGKKASVQEIRHRTRGIRRLAGSHAARGGM